MQCKQVHIDIDIDADHKHLYANITTTIVKAVVFDNLILRLCMTLILMLIRILICFAIGNMVLLWSALQG